MRGLVTGALTERDGYLDDLQAVTKELGKDFGLTWDPKVELTAVKGMDINGNWTEGGLGRIAEKLQEGRKVTDALRSTIMLPQDAAPRSAEYIEGVRAAMMARGYDVYLKNGKEDIDDRFLNPTPEGYRDIAFKFTKNGVTRELQLLQEHMWRVKMGMGHEILEALQERHGKQLTDAERMKLQVRSAQYYLDAFKSDNPALFGGIMPASNEDAMRSAEPSRISSVGWETGKPNTSESSSTSSSNVYPPQPLARSSSTVGNVRSDISITSNKSIPQFNEGTPVSGRVLTGAMEGVPKRRRFEAVTPRGDVRVSGEFQVVDVSSLITSDMEGYDQALQARNRDTLTSRAQIADIAKSPDPSRLMEAPTTDLGAPLVDENWQVVSGNGRTMGLREAYATNNAEAYRKAVDARARRYGLSTEGIANPVLVRVMRDTGGTTVKQVAVLSNQNQILQMNTAGQAQADADAIGPFVELFQTDESGNIRAASNRPFLTNFVQATHSDNLLNFDGSFSTEIDNRVKRAMLARVFKNSDVGRMAVQIVFENAEALGMKRVLDGVTQAAGRLVTISETKPQLDLTPSLGKALHEYAVYRQKMEDGEVTVLDEYLGQGDMFQERDPVVDTLIRELDIRGRKSATSLFSLLDRYGKLAEKVDLDTPDMFTGEVDQTTPQELLSRARQELETEAAGRANERANARREGRVPGAPGPDAGTGQNIARPANAPVGEGNYTDAQGKVGETKYSTRDNTTFFSTTNYNLLDERRFLLQRNQGDPKKAWSSLESMVLVAASNGDTINRNAIEAMRRALRLPRHYSQNLFGNLDRAERQYQPQESVADDEQGMLFSTLSPEMEAERDFLLKRAGGDTTRAWKIYERMVSAAATRGEPVDPRTADAMRRALLGTGEQADLFGEAAPEKEKRTFTKPAERPVQQSLEGLDEGTLFSTKNEASTPDMRYSTSQTDTPELKRWFGDSKVVDEDGKPLEVYHGTAAEFHTFEEGYGKSFKRRGIFFTDNYNVSEAFSASDKAIKKAYLNIRNPLIIDANGKHWTELEFEGKKIDSDDLAGIARERGYDGVIIRDVADPYPLRGNTYIALSPTQIKYSAETTYDNQGNVIPQEQRFDPQNPDSRYATGSGRAANRILAGDDAEGRPDLANPGLNDEARRGMRVADEYTYKDQERKRDEDTIAEAATLDRNKVRQKIMAGQGLSDAETLVGQEIITEAYSEAMRTGNLGALRRAVKLAHGWRVGGRELARSMRMRRDQMQTPAQRFEQALGAAFILPNKNVTSIQEQLGKDNISDQTRSELEQELEKELKKLALENARLRLKLARRGLVIDKLKRDLENAKTEREKQQAEDAAIDAVRDVMAARKGVGDALYEYWISSLLSGPGTQVVNISSNVVHTVWELGPQRIIEAFVNSFASKAEAAQWGEFKYMGAALKPGLSRALRNMVRSWKTERPTFQEEVSVSQADGSTIGLSAEHRGGAMDKYVGKRMARTVRIPLRGLLALDEFTKSMAGQMDAAAHAYRIGKGRGLRGAELERFIQDQVDDLSSAAWEAGLNTALRVTFQTPLSAGAEKASQWLGNTPGKWIIPFRRTPLNIFKTGIRKLPFGTRSMVKHWKTMDNDTKVRMLSEQVIAWSLAAAIAGLVLGGDDDDEPWITGSIPYKPYARGETLLKERTIPAQSIRIGGKYYSYARIEPFATILQGLVDATVAVKEIQSGRPAVGAGLDLLSKSMEAVTDKTFLRGLGDIYDALKQPESKGVSWVTNFATSWAPNIVKQVARATDSVYREQSLGKGGDYFDRLRDRIEYRVIPKADMLPPKRTPWGEEIRKIEGASPATDFFYRLLSPIANTTPAGRDPRAVKLDRLLTNWNNAHWDDTWAPEPPDRYITHNNTRYDLSDAEYDQLIKQCGEIALEHLEAYSLNSDFLTSSGLFNNYSESGSALF